MSEIDSSTFEREVRGSTPPGLARAALLFAREIAYPDLRPSEYLAQLDRWVGSVRIHLHSTDTVLTRVGHLSDYLFGTLGLKGNHADYTDPRNSYLNEVMTRRLGLPISLSAIFIEVGARIGLKVDGVGLPGHFIVGVQAEAGRYFFDPFNGGVEVTEDDAAHLVRQSVGPAESFNPTWLNATPPRDIIARMLSNLRNGYVEREMWPEAVAVIERLRQTQPGVLGHVRDLGLAHLRQNARRQAVNLLEDYLARAPDSPDSPMVKEALASVLNNYARWN
ncbi:MAG TPA: transglutaminase-like domain-containing protein [Anaerolineales bacterium]|nr:transglutaminase-like domain-containing protein [Anaerolineales bacterium]